MYDQKTRHDLFTGGAIASHTKYSKFSQNRPDWGKAATLAELLADALMRQQASRSARPSCSAHSRT
jgi:hypothetical protein